MKLYHYSLPRLLLMIILLSILMILASSLVVIKSIGTSKVSWTESRGFPLAMLTFNRYEGPCGPDMADFCETCDLGSIDVQSLIINLFIYIIISSLIIFLAIKINPALARFVQIENG